MPTTAPVVRIADGERTLSRRCWASCEGLKAAAADVGAATGLGTPVEDVRVGDGGLDERAGGTVHPVDEVLVGLGVRPATGWLDGSGIARYPVGVMPVSNTRCSGQRASRPSISGCAARVSPTETACSQIRRPSGRAG